MKIQANTIRPGNVIEHADKQWTVLKTEMLLPGKGNAFIQVEMRDVKSGNKTNERFRTSETVEKLMVEEKDATYLYAEDDQITFMDSESYEQFTVDKESIGDPAAFLQDGMIVTAELIEGDEEDVRARDCHGQIVSHHTMRTYSYRPSVS